MKDLAQCDVAVYTAARVAMAKQIMYLLLMGTAALTLLFVASSTRSSWYERGGNKGVVSALGPAAPSACCASSMLVAACPRRSGFQTPTQFSMLIMINVTIASASRWADCC
jgi:hypothetical protein